MYLDIGNHLMVREKRVIGIFDLEITSQSRRTAEFLSRAEQSGVIVSECEDVPKAFLVCDHPYHKQIVYLSQLHPKTLQSRVEAQER